ncbi:MAG: hypothetical protein NZ772_13725 [Cyanobacteria bacterium]|nr:hypothetical protein [Cyanobacteriota bacterium]MDW8202451.1 hypothetical protein [Cyanobacteriota bacterium SKYGB_h_bin112]
MSVLPSDRSNFRNSSRSQWPYGSGESDNWESRIDSEQMFQLIDTLLPFEACLYHQVLPLSIEKTNLHLGMVSPDDDIALEYVRRILAYVNYSLVAHRLPNDVHQNMLSAYLNYVGQRGNQKPPRVKPTRPARKVIEPELHAQTNPKQQAGSEAFHSQPYTAQSHESPSSPSSTKSSAESVQPVAATAYSAQPKRASFYQDDQATLITDIQDELPTDELPAHTDTANRQLDQSVSAPTVQPPLSATTEVRSSSSELVMPDLPPAPPPHIVLPPVLELRPKYIATPIANLSKLPPTDLLPELLARVLAEGIGRLFFEQQPTSGRILWSQNGVLQATLEELLPAQMQAIITELKKLSGLPPEPIHTAQQVEIERIYQNARILLRFRFMPGTYGEEATLQVLRGAALKFRQQQNSMERDVLGFVDQLQRKVDELVEHVTTNSSAISHETVAKLRAVILSLSEKLSQLEASERS